MSNKTKRELIKNKFGGVCAYCGKQLDDKWQIDHATPKKHVYFDKVNDVENLLPAISIVNHYKRAKTIEQFRQYLLTFHLRLAKLPKKTTIKATEKRIKYMIKVAELFNIEIDKPFNGKFYFENY